ncbi:serine hydrolase domain-containing protein [Thermaurantiacus sp.]
MRLLLLLLAPPAAADPRLEAALPEIRRGFADWMRDNRVPGLVWGIATPSGLAHVEVEGVADLATGAPVTADTAFRIASMSKAFTGLSILMLRDAGKLRLSDPVARHIPETASWAPATPDSPAITVGDLLHHVAGFVTDDPWGDRQQPMAEADFSKLLAAGVPMTRGTGTAFEYSNLGYAMLGRIITNASGRPYQQQVAATLFRPLGMDSTTYDVHAVPRDRLAKGYRFEGGRWVPEPELADGAFGAMGGVVTTARDYGKWMAFLLSAWPAGEAGSGPAARATVRAMASAGGPPQARARPGASPCRMAVGYGAGLLIADDCDLGRVLYHGGGYPGYGSHMLLLPEAGVGVFALANRTYAGPAAPAWDAALALRRTGFASPRALPVSPALARAYEAAGRVWAAGRIDAVPDMLAVNMLLDRSADAWRAELGRLRGELGACDTRAPVSATGALSGRFQWRCTFGRLDGQILLAPTPEPRIQALRLAIAGR